MSARGSKRSTSATKAPSTPTPEEADTTTSTSTETTPSKYQRISVDLPKTTFSLCSEGITMQVRSLTPIKDIVKVLDAHSCHLYSSSLYTPLIHQSVLLQMLSFLRVSNQMRSLFLKPQFSPLLQLTTWRNGN